MFPPTQRLALLTATALLVACGAEPQAAPRHPAGTVLVVAGVPVTAAEVDQIADRLAVLSPDFTRPHLRRLALTNCTFPMIAARRLGRDTRPEALRAAEEFHAARSADEFAGPLPDPERGFFKTLGIEVWMQLTELEPGVWSDVFEEPGAFVVARLRERFPAHRPASEGFEADLMRFPYCASRAEIDEAVYEQSLEIVDPEWRRIVPARWRLAMTSVDG